MVSNGSALSPPTNLDKYVSRHGGVAVFGCAQPPDQLLRRGDAAVVQQERGRCAVPRQEFQSPHTEQQSLSGGVLGRHDAQKTL